MVVQLVLLWIGNAGDEDDWGLQAMKFLQQAVGLRGYAQREPLAEYKLEGYALFLEMMAKIRRNVIYNVYCFRPALVQQKEKTPVNV